MIKSLLAIKLTTANWLLRKGESVTLIYMYKVQLGYQSQNVEAVGKCIGNGPYFELRHSKLCAWTLSNL